MLVYKLLNTPKNTKMLAILFDKALPNEHIQEEHIQEAIKKLYGENAKITSLVLNEAKPPLDLSACNDYIIQVRCDDTDYTAYNFACCFLDSKDMLKLRESIEDITECLKILRGDRYYTHPLYYKDFAQAIYEKGALSFGRF